MRWINVQTLVAHNNEQDIDDSYYKTKDTTEAINLNLIYPIKLSSTVRHNDRIVNSNVLTSTVNESLSEQTKTLQKEQKNRLDNCQKDYGEGTKSSLLNTTKTTDSFVKNTSRILSESQKEIYHDTNIKLLSCLSKHSIDTQNIAELKVTSDNIEHNKEACDPDCTTSVADNEPLNLVINSEESIRSHTYSKTRNRLCNYPHSLSVDKETLSVDGAILRQLDHSSNVQSFCNAKYKKVDYGLLKLSDLNELSCNSDKSKELFKTIGKLHASSSEVNGKIVTNGDLKQESEQILDKYVTHVLPSRLSENKAKTSAWIQLQSNVKCNNIKKEYCSEEGKHKSESTDLVTVCNSRLNNWACFEMSGQYPGHSRPPVGTPPPQTVWNHLTMTQGQALNIHPTALSGPALSPAGFYTHPSMARTSHLPSQLTPQLAHTQAPPTWHTPTVPSKSVTPANTPGNPLFSLQMLVDNRQNQNQYRNSPGSQSTLDLSSTSEIIPENYSRIPQDIPISLTARNVDKGSRNGNIISPPIPLNGETSSDSGISSSVPTPNPVTEPVSLSTKEITTPKISVKNFDNLKGVANLHDKIKEMNVDNFTQKVINLPPSVTIERVLADKKEPEASVKTKDTLSVIAQMPRNLPVIVNFSKTEKDVTDSPKRESSSERDRKHEETSVRSPKNLPKRGKKGVDSLLEKLEGGNKKLGSAENIGSVIVMPVEERDTSSVKSMSPERQKSKSPNREDEVVSPAFSNDDSNDNTKQRRKRKLEKPVRLSKDSKTEVEDMELEPTEPTEPRTIDPLLEETTSSTADVKIEEQIAKGAEERISDKAVVDEITEERSEESQPIRRRSNSENITASNATSTNQRTRRKSSEDALSEFPKVTSPKDTSNAMMTTSTTSTTIASTTTTAITMVTTATATTATNPFVEVESELAKMFAGIVEADPEVKNEESKAELASAQIQDDNATVKFEGLDNNILPMTDSQNVQSNPIDVSSTVDTKLSGRKGKKGKMQGSKRKISRSTENIFGTTDDSPLKETKKRRTSKGSKKQDQASKKTKKNIKIDGLREMAYDSGSNASSIRSRGPVVHVEGPRDSPLSIQVVNAPREEEEEKSKEKRKSVGNGNGGRSKRLSHQNDLDYRGKVSRAGLFSSTLSSRYDAHTTDSTWVCVFCKQGPHSVIPGDPSRPHPNLAGPHIATGTYTVPAGVLSDLFGPYLIGKERLEDGILSADEQEITTEQKKGGKNKRSLRYAGLADQFSAKMGKKKRNSVESNTNAIFTGMTLHPGGEEQRWEVWLHEQCAVWAAGVYMAGGRVTGLQEAVWDAAKSVCDSCGLTGANIGCVKRGCKAVSHYPCALTKGWHLDTNQYIPKCNLHRVT